MIQSMFNHSRVIFGTHLNRIEKHNPGLNPPVLIMMCKQSWPGTSHHCTLDAAEYIRAYCLSSLLATQGISGTPLYFQQSKCMYQMRRGIVTCTGFICFLASHKGSEDVCHWCAFRSIAWSQRSLDFLCAHPEAILEKLITCLDSRNVAVSSRVVCFASPEHTSVPFHQCIQN